MAAALLVLKIVLLAIACILGLVLLLAIFVLFCGFRYQLSFTAKSREDFLVRLRFSWLLHIVRVRYDFDSKAEGEGAVVKVLWFQPGKNKGKNDTNEKKQGKNRKKQRKSAAHTEYKEVGEAAGDEAAGAKEPPLTQRIKGYWEMFQKYRKIPAAVIKYKDKGIIIKYTIALIKTLWRRLKPKKSRVFAEFGLESPDKTGLAIAALWVLKASVLPNLGFEPNFERETLNADASFRGRSSLAAALFPIIGYALKPPVWRVIKKFLNREKKG